MKKLLLTSSLIACFALMNLSLFAQHDNLTNLSADFMRMPVRTAAYDAADIVFYNPAGTAFLDSGWHINLSNQSFFRNPTHTFDFGLGAGEKSFSQDSPDLFLPNLFVAYNKGKWAAFGGVFVAGGGGSVDYPSGSINTELVSFQALFSPSNFLPPPFPAGTQVYQTSQDQFIKGSSFYIAGTIGGAYKITDKLSLSLAGRYINASSSYKAGLSLSGIDPTLYAALQAIGQAPDSVRALGLEYGNSASGFGGVIGLDFKLTDKLNIGLHYESMVALEFETDSIQDDLGLIRQGQKSQRDLPGMFGVGASYEITDDFMVAADYNYFMQTSADWDSTVIAGETKEWSALAGNVSKIGLALQYKLNDKLTVSGGAILTDYMYPDQASMDMYYSKLGVFEVIKNDNTHASVGLKFNPKENFDINIAFGRTMWKETAVVSMTATNLVTQLSGGALTDDVMITTNNSVLTIALGVNIRF